MRPVHPRENEVPSFAIDFTYVPDKELLVAVEASTLFFIPIPLPKNSNATDVVAAIHCNLTMSYGAPHTITHDADCNRQNCRRTPTSTASS
jgi:hypothetical protein